MVYDTIDEAVKSDEAKEALEKSQGIQIKRLEDGRYALIVDRQRG